MMKTFAIGRMMIAVSCVLFFLGVNVIVAHDNGFLAVESSRKTHLRRTLGFQEQTGDFRLTSTANRRVLEEEDKDKEEATDNPSLTVAPIEDLENEDLVNETEELQNIEKEFDNENEAPENETEELENIETLFDGENTDKTGTFEKNQSLSTVEDNGKTKNKKKEELASKTDVIGGKETPTTNEPTEDPKSETKSPIEEHTEKPTAKPYTGTHDEFDPIKAKDEKNAEEEEVQELETELKQEEKVARRAGGLGIFLGIVAMIFTAHQMSENPDGIYASVCRLAITISSVIVKIVCMPCRKLIGAGGNGNPYNGHMPISTSDYNYRNDPYRSNANAGFEMS